MDEGRRALITHLMAEITARLEDATEMAVEGQSPKLDEQGYGMVAADISSVATHVHALAEAVSVLARADYGVRPTPDASVPPSDE